MILEFSLISAACCAALVVALTMVGGSVLRAVTTAAACFIVVLFTNWLFGYFSLPEFVGTLGGYGGWIGWNMVITAIIAWIASAFDTRGRMGSVLAAGVSTLVVVFCVGNSLVQQISYNWPAGGKLYFSGFAKVEIASPNETIPPSDTDHMKLTPADVACSRAGQTLGQNPSLSSIFKIDCSELTAQTVNRHVWYVAPLEYQSSWSQTGRFGNTLAPKSPGFVKVDGEDPMAPGILKVGPQYEMTYFPSGMWDQYLNRHIYEAGYTDGWLDDITPELDDNDKLWFTMSYNYYEKSVVGERISKVLIVDPQTGDIKSYNLGDTPEWVDRVMSTKLRERYVSDYLQWAWNPKALDNYSMIWGASGNQFKIQDSRLTFNGSSEHPMALMTISSNDSTNDAVVGVMVCATNDNRCKLYDHVPNMQPASHALAACDTAAAQQRNIRLQRDDTQLHMILDRLTWMAIYVTPGSPGIAGICLVDASQGMTQAANAVFASDLRTVLYRYGNKLLTEGNGDRVAPGQPANGGEQANGKELGIVGHVHGKIASINSFVTGGESFFTLLVKDAEGHGTFFIINAVAIIKVTALHKDDEVTVDYRLMTGVVQPMVTNVDSPALKDIPEEQMRFGASTSGAPQPAPAKP